MALADARQTAETRAIGRVDVTPCSSGATDPPATKEVGQMTLIRRPAPLVDLVSFRDAMERLFDERPFRPMWIGNGEREAAPALDLYTTPEAVIAKVALPGVKPEDVDVTIGDDLVTISGAFKEEKETSDAGYVHKELSQGKFSRSFSLPTAIKADAAKAEFKDGLLTLTIPKTEEVKPTHVKVQVT
jgi:HSP20 family protein